MANSRLKAIEKPSVFSKRLANIVTSSKAPVTTSDALVTTSFLLSPVGARGRPLVRYVGS